EPVRQDALRSDQGPRAGDARRVDTERARRSPVASGGDGEGADRARQGEAGRNQLRLFGTRNARAPGGGAVQLHGGSQDGSRAVQGRGAGARRPARRPGAAHVLDHAARAPAREGREAPRARGDEREALACRAGSPDARRNRAAGIRGEHLARRGGARGHAGNHRRAAQPRDRRDPAFTRRGRTVFEPGRRSSRQHAGGIRRLHQVGDAEVGQGRARFGCESGVRIAVNERRLRLTIAACLALPLAAHAQAYPSRPIRSIMTVAGGADIVARLVAQGLSGALGQPVVVETQSGAGGAIGADTVARAAPDGYTIMLTSASALVMNRFLSKSARLDPLGDFTPITKAFETVALVVTSPAFPVNSMRELIEYARRHPGNLSYGTSGIGTTHHLAGESIRLLTGIDWVHVPYKGGP